MRPLRNKVLIAELKEKKETDSGIILSSAAEERSHVAMVMAVGPECELVKVHDKVIPEWNKGQVAQIGDLQGVVISEDDILAVIED